MKVKKDIIIIFVIILAISMTILPNYLNDLDEIWNFNFARNVAEGNVPYRDFNMIVTPLFSIIVAIFLKVLGTELIVMRILAILLCSLIFFLIYKIMRLLKIGDTIINISLLSLYLLFFNHFRIDYNLSTLVVVLLVMYHEIKRIQQEYEILKYKFKSEIFLGILIGTTILLKQTAGIFISAIFILYKILSIRQKEDLKTAFKIVLTRTLGVGIPVLLLFIYLMVNNIWLEFLDYTVYGVSTFSNYIPYIMLIKGSNMVISILSVLVPISFIYMCAKIILKKQNTKQDKILFVLFVYSIATFIFVFPISDEIHFLIGSIPAIIAITYIFCELLNVIRINEKIDKNINIMRISAKFATEFFLCCIILISLWANIDYFININATSKLNHYKYIRVNDEVITPISEYILEQKKNGKTAYILDATAAVYMIPIDKYNKDYDMFNLGNLGSKGEEGQIERLEKEDNIAVLVMRDGSKRNWQTPTKVIAYIINNWEKTGEVEQFDIYERKE